MATLHLDPEYGDDPNMLLSTTPVSVLTRILAVVNQKGGVGKTTTTINLAAALAELGRQVLVIDLDPQANTTSGLGLDPRRQRLTVYHLLSGEAAVDDVAVPCGVDGLFVVPSQLDLAGAEIELAGLENREGRLRAALTDLAGGYGHVLIDCPPSLGLLTLNALAAAALILLPTGPGGSSSRLIALDQIRPSPEQMRRHFPADSLRELADSIREHGILQPVLVRPLADGYELIAGERRWRAARQAGLERIPALVREAAADDESLLLGLVENLQREDLDPIEEARGIQRLIDQFGLTQEETATRLGRGRVSINQALVLLRACPAVASATSAGAISPGHARALIGLPTPEDQERGLRVVLARRLNVRQTENWARSYRPAPHRMPRSASASAPG